MKTEKLNCNNCGSQIQIESTVKYFNCASCGCSMALIRKEDIVYTEKVENDSEEVAITMLEDIKPEKVDQTRREEILLIEAKIARLDRDWKEEEKKYQLWSAEVGYYLPEETNASGGFMAYILISITVIIFGFILPDPSNLYFIGFCVIAMVVAYIADLPHQNKYSETKNKYSEAKSKYLEKRKLLLAKLNQS